VVRDQQAGLKLNRISVIEEFSVYNVVLKVTKVPCWIQQIRDAFGAVLSKLRQ